MTKETFYRGEMVQQEARLLPAPLYKKILLVLNKSQTDCAFVSIRAMQYLAIIDHEEIIFVSAHARNMVAFAWQNFKNHDLEDIGAAIPYAQVSYRLDVDEAIERVQYEFDLALDVFLARLKSTKSTVIQFPPS